MYVDVSVLLIDDGKWKVNKFIREEKTISHIFLIYFALVFIYYGCAMCDARSIRIYLVYLYIVM